MCESCFRGDISLQGKQKTACSFFSSQHSIPYPKSSPHASRLHKALMLCVDIRSVLIPIIILQATPPPPPPNPLPVALMLFLLKKSSNAFYYVFAFPVCMSCSVLHVIKAGFWQSYHWPTAVITKGLHSCL